MLPRAFLFLAAAIGLAGCAIGNQYDYTAAPATVPSTGADRIAVAVSDMRRYVLSGDKSPTFVGLQRGGYGNPFDVTTRSGAPLARDFETMLVRSFENTGATAVAIPLAPGQGAESAVDAFRRTDADKLLLIEMREWKTDVMAQVTVHWDLAAKVYDRSGRLLGEDRVQGTRGTGSNSLFQLEEGKNRVATAEASRLMSELLSKPAVAAALR